MEDEDSSEECDKIKKVCKTEHPYHGKVLYSRVADSLCTSCSFVCTKKECDHHVVCTDFTPYTFYMKDGTFVCPEKENPIKTVRRKFEIGKHYWVKHHAKDAFVPAIYVKIPKFSGKSKPFFVISYSCHNDNTWNFKEVSSKNLYEIGDEVVNPVL